MSSSSDVERNILFLLSSHRLAPHSGFDRDPDLVVLVQQFTICTLFGSLSISKRKASADKKK